MIFVLRRAHKVTSTSRTFTEEEGVIIPRAQPKIKGRNIMYFQGPSHKGFGRSWCNGLVMSWCHRSLNFYAFVSLCEGTEGTNSQALILIYYSRLSQLVNQKYIAIVEPIT